MGSSGASRTGSKTSSAFPLWAPVQMPALPAPGAARDQAARAARAAAEERRAAAEIDPDGTFNAVADACVERLRTRTHSDATVSEHSWLIGIARRERSGRAHPGPA